MEAAKALQALRDLGTIQRHHFDAVMKKQTDIVTSQMRNSRLQIIGPKTMKRTAFFLAFLGFSNESGVYFKYLRVIPSTHFSRI